MESTKELKDLKNHFPISFKRWVAREIESGSLTYRQAQEQFAIPGHSTIYGWVERYGLGKELLLPEMTPEEKQKFKLVQKRVKELKKSLEHAKMKNIALETLIDVAEKEFKVSIRKKSGPKQ